MTIKGIKRENRRVQKGSGGMFKTFENFECTLRGSATMTLKPKYLIYTVLLQLVVLTALSQPRGFIANKGQWEPQILHKLPIPNGDFWLEEQGWSLLVTDSEQRVNAMESLHGHGNGSTTVDGHVVKVRWVGSRRPESVVPGAAYKPYLNYFLGNDPDRWASKVPILKSVVLQGIYDGINAHFEVDGQAPKVTYEVKPGADHRMILLHYSGHRGLEIHDGNLLVKTSIGDVVEQEPVAFQWMEGERVAVKCRFKLKGGQVGFSVGKYDPQQPLFIDPTIIASTNSGCTSEAFGHTATFNEAGQIYSAGRCFGTGYPTDTGAFQSNFGGPYTGSYYQQVDMCLSKYDQDASTLIYATYLGGNAEDLPHSMIVNDSDQVIILGSTNATNYPVSSNAYDSTNNGGKDIVITCLSSDGSALIGSTYLGGSGVDGVNNVEEYYADAYRGEVVLDSLGNIYIASFTRSSNFPATAGVFQDTIGGQQDGVVCKLNPDLSQLLLSTYIGGSQRDASLALKISNNGEPVVVGVTQSANLPLDTLIFNGFQGGATDAFMLRLSSNFDTLLASSYFGTSGGDQNYFVELDQQDGVYVFGTSTGTITATTGKYAGPGSGGYVYKTNLAMDTIEWQSTFGDLAPAAFLVDNCNRIYISGQGATSAVLNLNNFDTLDPVNSLSQAGFYLMKLSPDAEALEFGSFYGNNGSHVDGGTSRFDKRGVVYQATCSNGVFPTTSWAYSTTNQTNNATYDNTVFKIDFESNVAKADIVPGDSACAPFLALFNNDGSVGTVHYWDFGDGTTSTDSMPTHLYDSAGVYDIFYVITDTMGCYGNDTDFVQLTVLDPVRPTIIIGDTHCVDSVLLTVDTTDFASYLWSNGDTSFQTYVKQNGTYSITTTADLFCQHSDTVDVQFVPAFSFNLPDTGVCVFDFDVSGPNGAVNYMWSTGDTSQVISIDTTGFFSLTADNGTCEHTDSFQVVISYVDFLQRDTAVCEDSIWLRVAQSGGAILWSTGSTAEQVLIQTPGTYWVNVQNGYCSVTDTISVSFEPVLIDLGPDTLMCSSVTLGVDEPGISVVEWSTGDTAQSTIAGASGLYWVEVTDGHCTDRDSVRLTIESLAFETADTVLCDLDSVWLEAPSMADASYLWSAGSDSMHLMVNASGAYGIAISTEHCLHRDTIAVRFVHTPPFTLGPDREVCKGETLFIPMDTLYGPIVWSTGDTVEVITPAEEGKYWAGQLYEGCWRYDTIEVTLRELFSDSFSLINNVMTPNGDGMNDELKFHIADPSLVIDYHLWVYDRWGLKVFESTDPGIGWDGTRPSGIASDDGSYFYLMEVTTICEQRPVIEVRDNVTLLR